MADIIGTLLGIVGSGLTIGGEAINEKPIGKSSMVAYPVGGDPRRAGYESGVYSGMGADKKYWTEFEDTLGAKILTTAGSMLSGASASGLFDNKSEEGKVGQTSLKGGEFMDTEIGTKKDNPVYPEENVNYAANGMVIPPNTFESILKQITGILGKTPSGGQLFSSSELNLASTLGAGFSLSKQNTY